ncbi:hypothetical protein M8C21_003424 [Ambrosia artemisiifolia]|uniref:Uncharacterized protein n=1 Tax=Ambrosia artemisiifolia TaxID=4212 RepID=A0AAD5G4Z3_AMBAR|nr:hypothetical protein M8C21_003424 [Ambrosia artemisiifolia]
MVSDSGYHSRWVPSRCRRGCGCGCGSGCRRGLGGQTFFTPRGPTHS